MINKIYIKNESFIKYGFFGVITVLINLCLYNFMLKNSVNYIIASIISYFFATIVSYFFNTKFVFKSKTLNFKSELLRIIQYFSIRIFALILDTVLLIIIIELLKVDKLYAKIIVSVIVIIITYIFNKKILKGKN